MSKIRLTCMYEKLHVRKKRRKLCVSWRTKLSSDIQRTFYVMCACSYLYKYIYRKQDKLKKNAFQRGITLLYLFGCRKKWRLAYRHVGKLCSTVFWNFKRLCELWIEIFRPLNLWRFCELWTYQHLYVYHMYVQSDCVPGISKVLWGRNHAIALLVLYDT